MTLQNDFFEATVRVQHAPTTVPTTDWCIYSKSNSERGMEKETASHPNPALEYCAVTREFAGMSANFDYTI